MHPFISDWVCIQGRIIPKFYFGFLGAFRCTVLWYYGHQVGKACNFVVTDGVEDSLVHAIIAEEKNCVFLAAVLYPVLDQEESGSLMVYYFFGLLPNFG